MPDDPWELASPTPAAPNNQWVVDTQAAPRRNNAADLAAAGWGTLSGATLDTLSSLAQSAIHPLNTATAMSKDMADLRAQGDSELKSGDYVNGAMHTMAGIVPLIGPLISHGYDAILPPDNASFDPGEAGRAVGGLLSLKTTPEVMKGVGRVAQAVAAPLAETALGIRNINRVTSPEPGLAALKYTSGFRPETVSASAGRVIDQAVQRRNALLNASPNLAEMQPGQDAIAAAIQKAEAGNSDPNFLRPIENQLTNARPGVQATVNTLPTGARVLAPQQKPIDFLGLRQRIGQDFTKFDIARPSPDEAIRAGNATYKAMTDELHRTVPEAAPEDRLISDLIPVKDEGRAKSYNAGVTQNTLSRLARPTGALVGAAAGLKMGGLPGGVLGLIAPEIMSQPAVQMGAARGLYGAGGLLKSTPAQLAAQAALLANLKRKGLLEP